MTERDILRSALEAWREKIFKRYGYMMWLNACDRHRAILEVYDE